MKFSLITTVYNEEETILEFINSLNQQTEYPDEVIIVDGGSTDNTVKLFERNLSKDLNFKIIVDPTCNIKYSKGPISRGRNIAISNAQFENILVTDAGCVLDKNWVKEIKVSFIEKKADVVCGWYKPYIVNDFQRKIADVFCPPIEKINRRKFLPSSRSIGFKKWLWKKIDGYPEDTYTAEDTFFALKLFELTDRIIFNEKAIVYWHLPKNEEELIKKLYLYGYGEGKKRLFLLKNLGRMFILIFFPSLIVLILLGKKKPIAFKFYYHHSRGFIKGLLDSFFKTGLAIKQYTNKNHQI